MIIHFLGWENYAPSVIGKITFDETTGEITAEGVGLGMLNNILRDTDRKDRRAVKAALEAGVKKYRGGSYMGAEIVG